MQNRSSYSIFRLENGNITIISRVLSWVNQTENLDPRLLCVIRASYMPELTRRLHSTYKNNLATCIQIRV
jgi:hypothetical protein